MKFDGPQISDNAPWEVYEITDTYRRSKLEMEPGKWIIKTEFFADETLLAANKFDFDESHGKRWGEGQVVARVPLNKLYQDIIPHIKEGDKDHLKWWLNHDDAKPFRTFKGRI